MNILCLPEYKCLISLSGGEGADSAAEEGNNLQIMNTRILLYPASQEKYRDIFPMVNTFGLSKVTKLNCEDFRKCILFSPSIKNIYYEDNYPFVTWGFGSW